MTPNNYATLHGTIARAKRHDCQKVVMRVTLVEELLDQLSNAEKQIAALASENAGLKKYICEECYVENIKTGAKKCAGLGMPDTPTIDAFLDEMRAHAIKSALNACSECLDRDCIMESNGISYEDAALREAGAMALHDALLRQERAV